MKYKIEFRVYKLLNSAIASIVKARDLNTKVEGKQYGHFAAILHTLMTLSNKSEVISDNE